MTRILRTIPGVVLAAALGAGCASQAVTTGAPVTAARPRHDGRALDRARALVAQGRLGEAMTTIAALLAHEPPGRTRSDALELGAHLRMSADPTVRDLADARELLAERQAGRPAPADPFALSATLALLDEALRLQDALGEALADHEGTEQRATASTREVRQLRAELKELRAQLKKKEEALQKVAATVVNAPGKE